MEKMVVVDLFVFFILWSVEIVVEENGVVLVDGSLFLLSDIYGVVRILGDVG